MDPITMARSEYGELDSPFALLSQQVELEALMKTGLELDFHSPEYVKFRMEQEKVEVISPCKNYSLDSPSDSHSIFGIPEWVNEDDAALEAIMEAAEAELRKATQTLQTRARAKLLEDEETKVLMQEWGLNDTAFDPLPPADLAVVDAPHPSANGLGPVLQMRHNGSLRSKIASHFRASKAGQLIMQVSKPVVVPSEMGYTALDGHGRNGRGEYPGYDGYAFGGYHGNGSGSAFE